MTFRIALASAGAFLCSQPLVAASSGRFALQQALDGDVKTSTVEQKGSEQGAPQKPFLRKQGSQLLFDGLEGKLSNTQGAAEQENVEEQAAAEQRLLEACQIDEVDLACAARAPVTGMLDPHSVMGHFRGRVELPAELAAVAERELGETRPIRKKTLKELKARLLELEKEGVAGKAGWLSKAETTTITFPRKDDQFLIPFLRAKKFRVEDALKMVVNYTRFVHKHADKLTSLDVRDPLLDPHVCAEKAGIYLVPKTTRKGVRVIVQRFQDMERDEQGKSILDKLDKDTYKEDIARMMIRQMVNIYTMQLSDPWFQVKGVFLIYDFEDGPSFSQLLRAGDLLSPEDKADIFGLLHETIPMRFQGVMIMNQPRYISAFTGIVKPFLPRKLRERIHVIGKDFAKLHALVDLEKLPKQKPSPEHLTSTLWPGALDYAPYREAHKQWFPNWERHVCPWSELGIDAAFLEDERALRDKGTGACPRIDENAPPPYDGSIMIKQWVSRRRGDTTNDVSRRKASRPSLGSGLEELRGQQQAASRWRKLKLSAVFGKK